MTTFQDFEKIEIRVGTIVAVNDFPEARKPAYKLDIDLGPLGVKKSSAQITHLYSKGELIGKRVICVTNIGTRKVGSFESEVLTTGFYREDGSVVLAVPDKDIPNGARLG